LGGGVIASYPGSTPPEGGAASVRRLESRIDDAGGRRLGSVTVHYAAPYDLFLSLATNLRWVGAMWQVTLINALLIGTGCGVAAAAYVVSRLRSIDAVTSRWRQGDFAARVDLPSGDELAEHSVRLNAMAEELQSLFQLRQSVAVTEERQRVARELHDTVKQKLFALALQLAVVRSKAGDLPSAAAPIAESESLIHEAQRDLKEILTQLRPLDDVESPFSERLRSVLDDFVRRFPVSIRFEHDGDVQPRPTSEHHLVRIAQEAVTNAIRHGACDNVEISVTLDGERAALGIRDDGVGFEVARVTPGLGIRSIRERAAELPGGEATITSEPGGGAAVEVFWRHDGGSQQRH
ncbi:MAG: histidine kinase, partial [Acidobacteriota bacterium]